LLPEASKVADESLKAEIEKEIKKTFENRKKGVCGRHRHSGENANSPG
jgi:hypothetical protein